jgi:glycosyltransferase involved in cell wall biosynthesis
MRSRRRDDPAFRSEAVESSKGPALKRILFICENETRNQSTKHRVLDVIAFLKIADYRLYCGGKTTIGKSKVMLISVRDYFRIVRDIGAADLLFIQRTSNIFIYFLCLYAKRMGKTVVFDVDDAIFAKRTGMLKNPLYACFDRIARTSDYVFAGSHYIRDYAKLLNENTVLVPTAVNTEIFDASKASGGAAGPRAEFVIGWLGAGDIHLRSLMLIKEPLRALSKKYDITFKMVSSLGSRKIRDAFRDVAGLRIDYGQDDWIALEAIPEAMKGFDVSIMPLIDSPYMRGKCALKALESMAMKIPVVASGVGENSYVIRHGENGYLANTAEEWVRCIQELIDDAAKRRAIADSGYATVSREYTIPVVAKRIEKMLGLERG